MTANSPYKQSTMKKKPESYYNLSTKSCTTSPRRSFQRYSFSSKTGRYMRDSCLIRDSALIGGCKITYVPPPNQDSETTIMPEDTRQTLEIQIPENAIISEEITLFCIDNKELFTNNSSGYKGTDIKITFNH